jgi:transposase InsO family protein
MHLTLKQEARKPVSFSFLQQQERFDEFIEIYNNTRPHQALNIEWPKSVRFESECPSLRFPLFLALPRPQ